MTLRLLLVAAVCHASAALATNRALQNYQRQAKAATNFEAAAKNLILNSGGILLIDGDNVRGKSQFQLSHLQLLTRTARWAQRARLGGHVVLLVDHGTLPTSYHLPKLGGVSIAFSGPRLSADDVAARDVPWLHARAEACMRRGLHMAARVLRLAPHPRAACAC